MMSTPQERILLVEMDPEVSDLVARQALMPLGYRVKTVSETPRAIQEAVQFSPDVVLVNINLPGLSGKDLLVALSSQGVDVPVIVMAEEGMEEDVIQAFRLGASDFLKWPLREAEIVSAVERSLKQVRARRERERLARQLESTNRELKRRVRDLMTIFSIGKTVTSVTDQRALFDRIVEGAVFVTEADQGWLHLRKGMGKTFILSAQKNLPASVAAKLNQPWDDGISSLVALSGETLSIHGAPLKKFKVARLGSSALVVPVKAQDEVIGLLVVLRDAPKAFDAGNQAMLEAMADYVSVSLVNARLFQAVEERAQSLKSALDASGESEAMKGDILRHVSLKLKPPVDSITRSLDVLLSQTEVDDSQHYQNIRSNLMVIEKVIDALNQLDAARAIGELVTVNLVDIARQATARHAQAIKGATLILTTTYPDKPVFVKADLGQLSKVFDALLSNAIRHAGQGGEVNLSVADGIDGQVTVAIQNSGACFDEEYLQRAFMPFFQGALGDTGRMGIGLTLAKEIINKHGGKIWVDGKQETGTAIRFSLPVKVQS